MAGILINEMDQLESWHEFRELTPYANIYKKYIPENKIKVPYSIQLYYNGHYL